jgi:hypothetical protein
MKETRITIPELILVAGTRAALGAGLGLLLADRFSNDQRRAVGWTLVLVGVLSTVPLALEVFGGHRLSAPGRSSGRPVSRTGAEFNEPVSQQSELVRT